MHANTHYEAPILAEQGDFRAVTEGQGGPGLELWPGRFEFK